MNSLKLLRAYVFYAAFGTSMYPVLAQTVSASTSRNGHEASSLVTGIEAINTERYSDALAELRKAVSDSPHNVRLLQLTGYAALRAGSPHEAERYLQSALAEKPPNPWPLQVALINTYAAESRWSDFDLLRMQLRKARASGDPLLIGSGGYVAETFSSYGSRFEVIEYPALAGPTHIKYRFRIVGADRDSAAATLDGGLSGTYFDLEQSVKAQNVADRDRFDDFPNPDREFRLRSYRSSRSDSPPLTVAAYQTEPSYEMVRTRVITEAYQQSQQHKDERK